MVAEGTSGSMIGLYVLYNVIITILSVKCTLHGCRNNKEYVLIYLDILYKDIRRNHKHLVIFSCVVYIHTYIRGRVNYYPQCSCICVSVGSTVVFARIARRVFYLITAAQV
jgi:hypothetical protein